MLGMALGLGVLLAACAPATGLVPVPAPQRMSWHDDTTPNSLDEAIERSIAYYERVAPETQYTYGELAYAPREMAASLRLFQRLRSQDADPASFARQLAENFHVFLSVASDGDNLFTGYYEPLIQGTHAPSPGTETPVLARPPSLVEIELQRFGRDLPHRRLVGRLQDGQLLPFYSRKEIQGGAALQDEAQPLAYVNEVDLFFLQIQGSGVIEFPDGERIKVSYHGTNGHPYRSLGALLVHREAMPLESVTLQSIRAYLFQHPDEVRPLLFANPSYVFFRVVDDGPLGNIGVTLTAGRSLALDHRLFPRGGLVYVETELPTVEATDEPTSLHRFMLVQDTGGAIRGHGRGDIFWGHGDVAEALAGRLKHSGHLRLLVAKKEALQRYGLLDEPATAQVMEPEAQAAKAVKQ